MNDSDSVLEAGSFGGGRLVLTTPRRWACGWIPGERSVFASEQLLRLAFGESHLGHVLTGLE